MIACLVTFIVLGFSLSAQNGENIIKNRLADFFRKYNTTYTTTNERCKIERVIINSEKREVHIYTNELFAAQPFTPNNTKEIYKEVKRILPTPYNAYRIIIYGQETPIEALIPSAWSDSVNVNRLWGNKVYKGGPWVKPLNRPYEISNGLYNRHLAIWASHGRIYRNFKDEWVWQRPNIFCTTEDLFTQTFVIPFLNPMLENAGAYVFSPRERDWQKHEVIVDNDMPDKNGIYLEMNNKYVWETCDTGFAHKQTIYFDGENPFRHGTVRSAYTVLRKNQSSNISWTPNIPTDGRYAVYVAYSSLPNSVSDALYTVRHKGVTTRFKVNQQMGGGTWVYLGSFDFSKDDPKQNNVTLSNVSNYRGVVTADAVRFGGGMGNIARGNTPENASLSGLPRYLEGARYSAQWNGMPYTIYSSKGGSNDYGDDINVRSYMTNYLASGSTYLPADSGLHVPIELALAFHSDAGFSRENNFIGTLGIYTTSAYEGKLAAGISRLASRDLCDMVMTEVDKNITTAFGKWNRRQMFDRNYSESREPQIPSMILECLSHQNFADLSLGFDPVFKFTVARAVYKAILKYTAVQHNIDFIVQPLPVCNFSALLDPKKEEVHLSWSPVKDSIEPTAIPDGYIVYTQKENEDFDNGTYVHNCEVTLPVEKNKIYTFKVTAVNKGGQSFPSEELSVMKAGGHQASILIVNGFQRLAGPQPIDKEQVQGFDLKTDPGVAYGHTPEFSGIQLAFDKTKMGSEKEDGLGFSDNELIGKLLAGNTFNYTLTHGQAIKKAEKYSFSSCSKSCIEKGKVNLNDYNIVDLILGLEKNDNYSLGKYKTFTPSLQRALEDYTRLRGSLLISGAYVGSDMQTSEEKLFTKNILKYEYQGALREDSTSLVSGMNLQFNIYRQLNETHYSSPSVDCILPTDDAYSVMLYAGSNRSAAIAYGGKNYRCVVFGFPFETICKKEIQEKIMEGILKFLMNR